MVLCFIFRGAHKRQAGQVCRHLLFLRPEGAAKMLVGEALGFLFRSRGFNFTVGILDEMANVFYKFKTGESDPDK